MAPLANCSRQVTVTLSLTEHDRRLRELGCVVSAFKGPLHLHHCKGGSMLELGPKYRPGGAQRQNEWLKIPLAWEFHTGHYGIDTGMGPYKSAREWEQDWGRQLDHLADVSLQLGYNVFRLAGIARPVPGLED